MGFDQRGAYDTLASIEGVDVLTHESRQALLNGVTLDFAEVSPGQPLFVFHNPNILQPATGWLWQRRRLRLTSG